MDALPLVVFDVNETSLSILNSELISESIGHRCLQCGVRTIRFLYLPEPRHSGGIIRKQRSTFIRLAISPWKLIVKKLGLLFATSSVRIFRCVARLITDSPSLTSKKEGEGT